MLQKIKKNGSELAAHPAAEIFPMLDEKPLRELAADIEQHGQQEAIETYEGQILDGRNRLKACRLAKVEPLIQDVTVELREKKLTPHEYVVSKNLHRRHLTESQRAMVAESLASSKHGGDRKSDNKNQESNLSLEKSAEQLNVSKTSVKNARTVKRSGDKELVKQVVSGKKKVSKAAAEVKARSPKKKAAKKKAVKKKTAAPKESTSDCKPVSPYSWPESEIKIQAVTEAFLKSVESGDFKGEFWFTTDEDFGSVLLAFVSRVFDKADNKLKASIEKQWKIVVEWEPGCNVLSPFWALKIPKTKTHSKKVVEILSALKEGTVMNDQQAGVRNGYAIIEVARIKPSPWNPNRMDGKKFAEYVAEVKHLGRLPKPTVVRPNCDGFEIVDGEHGWRAAQEIGLKEIDCEIVEADDFEAMRQTYKRNQSGKHNKVLQGRMFRQMLEARDLSQRQLAKEIQVSEGTVRNSLLYAEAVERREVYLVEKAERRKALGYKTRKNPPTAEEEFDKLTARQVRCYMKLPTMLGNMWLDSGSELRTFFAISSVGRIKGDQLDAKLKHPIHDNFVFEYAEAIEESGLLQYADPVHSNGKFVAELKGVRERMDYRDKWRAVVSDHEELDRFLKPHFEDNFFVDSTWSMDEIFEKIVDLDGNFLITSEEFLECLRQQDQQSQSRRYQFEQRIELLVIQKHGALPANNSNVERQLEQLEFEKNAPDFIKACAWESAAAKQKLFEKYQDADEETRQAIEYAAQLEEPKSVSHRIKQIKRKLAERAELAEIANQDTCQELADAIIDNMFRGRLEQAEDMKQKLATFSKRDLAVLHCLVYEIAENKSFRQAWGLWDSLNDSEFDWLNQVVAEEGSEASE